MEEKEITEIEDIEKIREEWYEKMCEALDNTILFSEYNPSPAKSMFWKRILLWEKNEPLLNNFIIEDFFEKQTKWASETGTTSRVAIVRDHTLYEQAIVLNRYLTEGGFESRIYEKVPGRWQYDFVLEFVEAMQDGQGGERYLLVLYDKKLNVEGWVEFRGMV